MGGFLENFGEGLREAERGREGREVAVEVMALQDMGMGMVNIWKHKHAKEIQRRQQQMAAPTEQRQRH